MAILLMAAVMPVLPATPASAQDDEYALFLTDDEAFGFVYPSAWEQSIDEEYGTIDLGFDDGFFSIYSPEVVAGMGVDTDDPIAFLQAMADAFGSTAEDVSEFGDGAMLSGLEEVDGTQFFKQVFVEPMSDGTLSLIVGYIDAEQFDQYTTDIMIITLTMDAFEPGEAYSDDDVAELVATITEETGDDSASESAAGDSDYVLYLSEEDEGFGFIYPSAWELSVESDGMIGISFDAGLGSIYPPEVATEMVDTSDAVVFLQAAAEAFGGSADDVSELGDGATLNVLSDIDGTTYVNKVFVVPMSDGTMAMFSVYVEGELLEQYLTDFIIVSFTMDTFAPGEAYSEDDVAEVVTTITEMMAE